MSDAMVNDPRFEAVSRAAWDADAAFLTVAVDGVGLAPWSSTPSQVRESFRSFVESCLRGETPDPVLWQARSGRRRQLFIGIVRCTAAALGMTIVYGDGVTRDWSQPQP